MKKELGWVVRVGDDGTTEDVSLKWTIYFLLGLIVLFLCVIYIQNKTIRQFNDHFEEYYKPKTK